MVRNIFIGDQIYWAFIESLNIDIPFDYRTYEMFEFQL